ncbi:urea ABC transporter ATP-binding protein UrtD [Cohnella sp. CIP 111063]|uniref:urea ABC transporter ATP-binding protein UrtD n=1 Tax=unclassified Cohnella TaxID=2636738 RepID=UPI000B8C04D8|nr:MULTISPECIES: urea ABC transporter ATP-binding protein UrtD [unclassified Cohnella]OXS54690.1 urea ABC transporter ATP-binding protein UrtD [Cohnella sp. CIP 111063]PRX64523.1 urea ABC transporter ATP-binding protein [Cohnella sp. SGD-V74]
MKSPSILSCQKVTVSFDGFKAVQEMSLELASGELRFLIGPNGAGKTTMLDAICGKVKPAGGVVEFHGRKGTVDVTRRKEHEIAQLGIGRKFQTPSIFSGLTVEENLEIAMAQNRGVWATLRAAMTKADRERVDAELELIGLEDKKRLRAGLLSHGEKQWLEIGMMLLQEPEILLLDEPVAGMTDKETDKTGELLREIVRKRTVVVVEHDMEFVRNFASKVTVMHEGKLLKEGSMDEVQRDDRVAEVYLGRKRRDYDAVGSTA